MIEQEIRHKQAIKEKHVKRFRVLEQQAVGFGTLYVPPHVTAEIEELKEKIIEIDAEIKKLEERKKRSVGIPSPVPPSRSLPPSSTLGFPIIVVTWFAACFIGLFAECLAYLFLFPPIIALFYPNFGLAMLVSLVFASITRIYIQYRMVLSKYLLKAHYWINVNIFISIFIWIIVFVEASFDVPNSIKLLFILVGYNVLTFFIGLWLLDKYRRVV